MDLVVYQMMQFQVMHVSDCYRTVKVFTGTSVTKANLTVSGNRNALPQFSMGLVLIQILHNVRSKYILIFCTELFKVLCVYIIICQFQSILNVILVCTVKYRSCNIEAKSFCSKT